MASGNPIAGSRNRLKLGVFGLNVSGGCAMTGAADTLKIEWQESVRIARAAEAAGIEKRWCRLRAGAASAGRPTSTIAVSRP
jgi:hypothetical protein